MIRVGQNKIEDTDLDETYNYEELSKSDYDDIIEHIEDELEVTKKGLAFVKRQMYKKYPKRGE